MICIMIGKAAVAIFLAQGKREREKGEEIFIFVGIREKKVSISFVHC